MDRYFDGGWVWYALAFIAGMGFYRFAMTPSELSVDTGYFAFMIGLCLLVLGLRFVTRDM